MAGYDYDGSGKERELCCSAHTLMVYEQQFKTGMIEDVFGVIKVGRKSEDDDDDVIIARYDLEHWGEYVKALWAMLKSGADLARHEGRPYEKIPSFEEWSITATNLDLSEISRVVVTRCQEDLFRTGASGTEAGEAGEES